MVVVLVLIAVLVVGSSLVLVLGLCMSASRGDSMQAQYVWEHQRPERITWTWRGGALLQRARDRRRTARRGSPERRRRPRLSV